MTIDSADLLARFLRYVQIDTRSDAHSATTPTTPGQWDLLRLLTAELTALGATEVTLTAHGYVLATIPATVTQPVPVMAKPSPSKTLRSSTPSSDTTSSPPAAKPSSAPTTKRASPP